jgi:hypothetical protein
MPLEQFVGYTIMDSIITYGKDSFPTSQAQKNFIKSLTCTGDTLNYALKYLYLLADYNPFLYYNFLTSYQTGKQQPMSILTELLNHVKKECGQQKFEVMKAEYILHLQINQLEPFVYESSPPEVDPITGGTYTDSTHLVYAYTIVLDTIKGQVFPDIGNAIEVFLQDSDEVSTKKSTSLSVPTNTNFMFYFSSNWNYVHNTLGVNESNEYIVFLWTLPACVNDTTGYQYYEMRPTVSDIVFPIVDGNVIDKRNKFGWGTSIPLATFKQNLQELIDSIKEYGE